MAWRPGSAAGVGGLEVHRARWKGRELWAWCPVHWQTIAGEG